MTTKQITVKKYVVKLRDEERGRLNTLIHAGRHPARLLTKARIVLKADASEAGEGWSDSQIAAALDTSIDTVAPPLYKRGPQIAATNPLALLLAQRERENAILARRLARAEAIIDLQKKSRTC